MTIEYRINAELTPEELAEVFEKSGIARVRTEAGEDANFLLLSAGGNRLLSEDRPTGPDDWEPDEERNGT